MSSKWVVCRRKSGMPWFTYCAADTDDVRLIRDAATVGSGQLRSSSRFNFCLSVCTTMIRIASVGLQHGWVRNIKGLLMRSELLNSRYQYITLGSSYHLGV